MLLWLVPSLVLVIGLLTGPLAGVLPSIPRPGPAIGWILVATGLLGVLFVAGWWWRGTPHGIYSTPRNVASLAALQAFLWLGLIASLLLVVSVWNVDGFGGESDAVRDQALQVGAVVGTAGFSTGIVVIKKRREPTESSVLALAKKLVANSPEDWAGHLAAVLKPMATETVDGRLSLDKLAVATTKIRGGDEAAKAPEISSLLKRHVGTLNKAKIQSLLQGKAPVPLDKALKVDFPELREVVKQAAQALAVADLRRHRDGTLYRNLCPCEAKFSDILEGDEISNGTNKELGRVQFLVFTVVGVVAFTAVIWTQFKTLQFTEVFVPTLPDGLTELLAISGAGYLGYKLPSRTPHQE